MKKRALLLPGQCAAHPGMGHDFYRESAGARAVFDKAETALDIPLRKLCFEGPAERLIAPSVGQAAAYTTSWAILEAIRDIAPGFEFAAAAGISSGEITAFALAGGLSFHAGLRLAQARGAFMQDCAYAQPGQVAFLRVENHQHGRELAIQMGLQVAAVLSPTRMALGGSVPRIATLQRVAVDRGMEMHVYDARFGAAHTPMMLPAQEHLHHLLAGMELSMPSVPVISTIAARPALRLQEVREALISQLCNTLRWEETVRYLLSCGVEQFIELGAGRELTDLCAEICPGVECISIATWSDLQQALAAGKITAEPSLV
ncbi:[acyl-carrier-protein] S-malonyltransferase [Verrucomicrobia bacterium LW23]|nr:[acyl-carrier-protein] S-malonyltransferase [Verrucomicrobia bacterium LW23]